ncbi:MAG: tRNA (adenosine(37)-N6)-threonylcarbamoyltransferase complex transferase subunit TsaD [Deltaproteobacteria bacterium]|nr:tRNA (adenosine(37)-N6)-threonylcarbamoyltransferase complex transferase subunit TsaD [Deltaproteobacteria bacterium]
MKILGIETSCDETAVAVVKGRNILSNVIASQTAAHAPFGGVVPEIASRHHIENIPLILDQALALAGVRLNEIDGIAATCTPGLLTALLVGLQFGKSLAFALKKPFVGVNHIEGHLNSVFLAEPSLEESLPQYPYLGLIVSGGHTHLYQIKKFGRYQLLGATKDDACGEAYDKVAKLLGLGYPGGPKLDKLAALGNPKAFRFTQPRLKDDSLDFSFSGVKTACLLQVQKQNGILSENFIHDMAASFQNMATDYLITRIGQAARRHNLENIAVTGGVAANSALRAKLKTFAEENDCRYFIPSLPLCTDNGAMIAYVGGRYLEMGLRSPLSLNAQAYSGLPA